jgi:hypothetical protein
MKAMLLSICHACAILILMGSCLASAAPKIPSSALPGRERERFIDPPIARFFWPGAPAVPLLTRRPDCRGIATKSRQQRSKRRKNC